MIVHRGEVDVRLRDDVAQGDVAEAAVGIEPLGGGEDGGSGLIARHGFHSRHSGAMRSIEPEISRHNLQILRCAIAHHSSALRAAPE